MAYVSSTQEVSGQITGRPIFMQKEGIYDE